MINGEDIKMGNDKSNPMIQSLQVGMSIVDLIASQRSAFEVY